MAEWSIPFEELAERANKSIEEVVRGVTLLLFTRVVLRSPVDTGRFRANWLSSYGAPKLSTLDATDMDGRFTVAGIKGDVMAFPIGGVVYLCNSLPYAQALEYGLYPNPPIIGSQKRGESAPTIHVVNGYSMQAPGGMVRITAMEMDGAIKEILQ